MGEYSTKAFFKKRLEEYLEGEDEYFEISTAPDCCPICKLKENRKIAIATASEDDYPPFHSECRCCVLPA